MMSLASLSFRVLLTLIIAPLLSRKRSVSCSLQKLGMMRRVRSLHLRMRQLRGNAPRTGAYKRNVVIPHLELLHEALFSAHAHRSIPCLVRQCHEVRTHVVSCNVHSTRTAPLLSSSTRCVLRVVREMISFSSIEKIECHNMRQPALNSMPLSAELLANNGIDTILTLNQIQLANHIESMRNGWMTLAQDGLTSKKKVYARVTKMKFERRALCCVCVQKQRASLFNLDIISCHSAPQHLVPSGLRVCKTRRGKGPHGFSLHIQPRSAPAGPSHLQSDSRSSRATPRWRHARVDGRSCTCAASRTGHGEHHGSDFFL